METEPLESQVKVNHTSRMNHAKQLNIFLIVQQVRCNIYGHNLKSKQNCATSFKFIVRLKITAFKLMNFINLTKRFRILIENALENVKLTKIKTRELDEVT